MPPFPEASSSKPSTSSSTRASSSETLANGSDESSGVNGVQGVGQPHWNHRVASSFSALAQQIQAASQAIALVPPLPDQMFNALMARMDEIEKTQQQLAGDMKTLQEQIRASVTTPEDFQKALETFKDEFKLDQQRLQARLHNSHCTASKNPIKPLIMANGKVPPIFPSTRGEFEHMIKERYEGLLKSYGLPLTGDTKEKRDACREFLGLPSNSL